MPQAGRKSYIAGKWKRNTDAHIKLLKIIRSAAPDAVFFREELEKALAAGFPIDWQDNGGWTLLHYTVELPAAVRAGLPQVLIDAGADVDAESEYGESPLETACLRYMHDGSPECLAAIDSLLEAGARPELGEKWTGVEWYEPEDLERCSRLEAYIASWPARRARDRSRDTAPGFDYAR